MPVEFEGDSVFGVVIARVSKQHAARTFSPTPQPAISGYPVSNRGPGGCWGEHGTRNEATKHEKEGAALLKNPPTVVAVLFLASLLSGCSSLKHLASKPPATVITLKAPLTIKYTLGGDTILPAGDYRATLEDAKGYYYATPGKVISNSTVGWQYEGGLYMPRGAAAPTHYYIIGRHNATLLHRLKGKPDFELKL